jgi:serine/threonine protein kinase
MDRKQDLVVVSVFVNFCQLVTLRSTSVLDWPLNVDIRFSSETRYSRRIGASSACRLARVGKLAEAQLSSVLTLQICSILEMKGWLNLRTGSLLLASDRQFFRLQWGFLSQYMNERSTATRRFCVHAATISCTVDTRKIVIIFGPLGILTAHGTDSPLDGRPSSTSSAPKRHVLPWRRPNKPHSMYINLAHSRDDYNIGQTVFQASQKPLKLVLIADSDEEFRLWALMLDRARVRNISRWYRMENAIGKGAAGDVFRATSISNPDRNVAVKRIEYHVVGQEGDVARQLRRIQKEIQTQYKAATRSPYVVQILDVFFDSRYVYVVMNFVQGGSLRVWLDTNGALPESFSITIMQQLCRAVLVLHQHKIVHRDIKADNCVMEFDVADSNGTVVGTKLTDFGFAEVCRGPDINTFCSTFLGTASYMSPEIAWFDNYGAPADMFALGILCHAMLLGYYPFDEPGLIATLEKIKSCELNELREATGVSRDAKSFCLALLNADPLRRISAIAALQHRWLRRGHIVTTGVLESPMFDRSPKAWFRRAVNVVLIVRRWTCLAAMPRLPRKKLTPEAAASRIRMLLRLDEEMKALDRLHVPRPLIDDTNRDDAEVFVDDDCSKTFEYSCTKLPVTG